MAFKLIKRNTVIVPVKGVRSDEAGGTERFEFTLVCKRLDDKQIRDAFDGRTVDDFLHYVTEGWRTVLDAEGQPLPFSTETFTALLLEPGVSKLAFDSYMREVEARAKN